MNILNGMANFLNLIDSHWTEIVVVAGLGLAAYKKVASYLKKSDDEKIELAKSQVKQIMLKLVTEAEERYLDWEQAGAIKRSLVISQIYETYPILSRVIDQDALIQWVDDMIDDALKTMRKILEQNSQDAQE